MKLTKFYLIPAGAIMAIGFLLMALDHSHTGRWSQLSIPGKIGMVLFLLGMAYIFGTLFWKMITQNRK